MSESIQLPPAAVIVTHEVADWETWKAQFDRHEAARKAAGILGHHINRGDRKSTRLNSSHRT